jgi:hypothetical protein
MEHTGLSSNALAIERSAGLKTAFVDTITSQLGFEESQPEILLSHDQTFRLQQFLAAFDEDGHPAEEATTEFLGSVLSARGGSAFGVGAQALDICVWTPEGWRVIGGYAVTRDGQPWTIEAAVAEYESRHGKIADPAVRAELAAIRV